MFARYLAVWQSGRVTRAIPRDVLRPRHRLPTRGTLDLRSGRFGQTPDSRRHACPDSRLLKAGDDVTHSSISHSLVSSQTHTHTIIKQRDSQALALTSVAHPTASRILTRRASLVPTVSTETHALSLPHANTHTRLPGFVINVLSFSHSHSLTQSPCNTSTIRSLSRYLALSRAAAASLARCSRQSLPRFHPRCLSLALSSFLHHIRSHTHTHSSRSSSSSRSPALTSRL